MIQVRIEILYIGPQSVLSYLLHQKLIVSNINQQINLKAPSLNLSAEIYTTVGTLFEQSANELIIFNFDSLCIRIAYVLMFPLIGEDW